MPSIEFEHLSPRKRFELIEAPLTPAQAEELDRRAATADEDLASSTHWETIKAEAAGRRRRFCVRSSGSAL